MSLFQKPGTRLPSEKNFVFKPSLDIGYNNFNNPLGSFNNLNKSIYIGSYVTRPTFTQTEFDGEDFTSSSKTYTTQTLGIAYLQRSCVLSPQIAFGNNEYKHIFHWEILVGAYFSLVEAIGVKFTQEASDDTNQSSSFYAIGSNATSATFNGKPITSTPFRFSGFKIGFTLGISTGPPRNRK